MLRRRPTAIHGIMSFFFFIQRPTSRLCGPVNRPFPDTRRVYTIHAFYRIEACDFLSRTEIREKQTSHWTSLTSLPERAFEPSIQDTTAWLLPQSHNRFTLGIDTGGRRAAFFGLSFFLSTSYVSRGERWRRRTWQGVRLGTEKDGAARIVFYWWSFDHQCFLRNNEFDAFALN